MNILQNKKDFDIIDNITIIDKLPVANYELKYGAFGRIYLSQIDDIEFPEKIYSNDNEFIGHVLNQWQNSNEQLGIGLVGGKGLGKSFTGNVIAHSIHVPVIRITSNPKGLDIFSFLNTIKQNYCIYIDEFEKMFPFNIQTSSNGDPSLTTQDKFLSFLDNGSAASEFKRMFIVTSNSHASMNDFLKNRPSRLRYIRMYDKLSDKIINEIVKDLLKNKDLLNDLIEHLPYNNLNMDALIQIINEVNIHNKAYSSFKDFFNFQELGNYQTYTIIDKESKKPINESITAGQFYRDSAIGSLNRKSVYLRKTLSLKDTTMEAEGYYYVDNDIEVTVDIIIQKNEEANKFKFLL